jgi:predicted secreted protein
MSFAKIRPFLLVLLSCTLVCGPSAKNHRELVFTEMDSDKTHLASVGDFIVFKLQAVPANGYVWHVTAGEGVAQTKTSRFELVEPGQPGARGVQVFEFVIRQKGQHELRFSYERGETVARVCTFRLKAQ